MHQQWKRPLAARVARAFKMARELDELLPSIPSEAAAVIEVTVTRRPTGEQGTFGQWAFDNRFWPTIELPWDDNSPHYSCIPDGTYDCELDATSKWSPRPDGRLFHVLAVPNRSLIKIHAATWGGDVRNGWHSDLLGCIAPGRRTGLLAPPDTGKLQACVLESRAALTEIMDVLGDDPFRLTIAWEATA